MGVSAIGALGSSYSQNHHDLEAYNAVLDAGRLPIARGLMLDVDDQLRRAIIVQLICHFQLVFASFEQSHTLDFRNYFARKHLALGPLQQDGLLRVGEDSLRVLPKGRLLILNICMVWDRYLPRTEATYSRAI